MANVQLFGRFFLPKFGNGWGLQNANSDERGGLRVVFTFNRGTVAGSRVSIADRRLMMKSAEIQKWRSPIAPEEAVVALP